MSGKDQHNDSITTNNLQLPVVFSVDQDCTRNQCQDPTTNRNKRLQDTNNMVKYKKCEQYIQDHHIKRTYDTLSDYHFKFTTFSSKPRFIYYLWDYSLLNKKLLGIVWPRLATPYGKKIVSELLEAGRWYWFATISWLADGIDSWCMNESIRNSIPTIAVLWWWIGYFMRTKSHILQHILNNWWLILSEFKIPMRPTNYTFPQRNRIIAWLSDVLLIPEASIQSGSLITVDFAIKGHKPVVWAPNNIRNEHSLGVNKYIHEWKITALYDIWQFLSTYFDVPIPINTLSQPQKLSPQEEKVLNYIDHTWTTIDQLLKQGLWSLDKLMSTLTLLEINNHIQQTQPNWYEKI